MTIFEHLFQEALLDYCEGNQSRLARMLEVESSTAHKWVGRLNAGKMGYVAIERLLLLYSRTKHMNIDPALDSFNDGIRPELSRCPNFSKVNEMMLSFVEQLDVDEVAAQRAKLIDEMLQIGFKVVRIYCGTDKEAGICRLNRDRLRMWDNPGGSCESNWEDCPCMIYFAPIDKLRRMA